MNINKGNAKENQAKSAEQRSLNAQRRNGMKALIKNRSVKELLDDYNLNLNLTNEQRLVIQMSVLEQMLITRHQLDTVHAHKLEQMLFKSELDEMLKEQPDKTELSMSGGKFTLTELLKKDMIDLDRTSIEDFNNVRSVLS